MTISIQIIGGTDRNGDVFSQSRKHLTRNRVRMHRKANVNTKLANQQKPAKIFSISANCCIMGKDNMAWDKCCFVYKLSGASILFGHRFVFR